MSFLGTAKELSKAAVEDAVARKAGWIAQHQEQTRQLMEERAQQGLCNRYEDGGEIAYLGKQYPLYSCTST